MRTIGLLGGMSWESSIEYYRIINQETRRRLGGTHSARSVLVSVDFHEIEAMQNRGDWDEATRAMIEGARAVQAAGADCLVICTNTMHRMAVDVGDAIDIPLLHIADATGDAVRAAGVDAVALLGTRFTMESDFYRGRLEQCHGLTVLIPNEADRTVIHDIIYDELVQGIVTDSGRNRLLAIIGSLIEAGAEGVVAGCTEIELLVTPADIDAPYFPTARLHAEAAVAWALET